MAIDERDVAGVGAGLCQLLSEELERFVPRRCLELSVSPHHRSAIAIGIVQPLQACLSPRAQRAAVERMLRISLELDCSAVARFRNESARRQHSRHVVA